MLSQTKIYFEKKSSFLLSRQTLKPFFGKTIALHYFHYYKLTQDGGRRPVTQLQFWPANISASKVYNFEKYLIVFMNA